jgi:hypothetical protein
MEITRRISTQAKAVPCIKEVELGSPAGLQATNVIKIEGKQAIYKVSRSCVWYFLKSLI